VKRQTNNVKDFLICFIQKTMLKLLTNLLNVAGLAASHVARLVIALGSRSGHRRVAVCISGAYTTCEMHINDWKHKMNQDFCHRF